MLTWLAFGTGDVTIDKPFVCRAVAKAARAPAALCTSKQTPSLPRTTCRKLAQNASKCTNIVYL